MFTKQHLQDVGFNGFIPLLGDLRHVPARPCIYTVVWDGSEEPNVVARSSGGWFKRKDPTVDVAVAEAKLVSGCETLYIGRAQNGRDRLALLARFGRGQPVAHWGGRYLWQLQSSASARTGSVSSRQPTRRRLDSFSATRRERPRAYT
jgi:hypothetical protein